MRVLGCGTRVVTKVGNKEGMICEICIKFDSVIYGIKHIKDGGFDVDFFKPEEFVVMDPEQRNQIGFKKC